MGVSPDNVFSGVGNFLLEISSASDRRPAETPSNTLSGSTPFLEFAQIRMLLRHLKCGLVERYWAYIDDEATTLAVYDRLC